MLSRIVVFGLSVATPLSAQTVPLATYAKLTRIGPDCTRAGGEDIVVCARRNADCYRLPLVEYDAGDPRAESVAGERQRLQAQINACEQRSALPYGCGMVGVSVRVDLASGGVRYRPVAP